MTGTTKQAQARLDEASSQLTMAQGRLEAANRDFKTASETFTQERSDAAWDAREAAGKLIERRKLELAGHESDVAKATTVLAKAQMADLETQLRAAAVQADLGAPQAWGGLYEEASAIYRRLGELHTEVLLRAQACRTGAARFDSLVGAMKQHAKANKLPAPSVPEILRQPPGELTRRFFRETLLRRVGDTDERWQLVPVGGHEEGHLEWLMAHHGVVATDDVEKFSREKSEEARRAGQEYAATQSKLENSVLDEGLATRLAYQQQRNDEAKANGMGDYLPLTASYRTTRGEITLVGREAADVNP
jgi:hypothetical protein